MKASSLFPAAVVCLTISLAALSTNAYSQPVQWTVQIDSMTAAEPAQAKVQQLAGQGLNAYLLKSNVPGQGLRYRVRIGHFASRAAAQSYGARLKQQGTISDYFVAVFEGPVPVPVKKPATPPPAAEKTDKNSTPASAQRQRAVKVPPPAVGAADKPQFSAAPVNSTSTPASVSPGSSKPVTAPAMKNPDPKSAAPGEKTPRTVVPIQPAPPGEVKPPRDKKASNEPVEGPPPESRKADNVALETAEPASPSQPSNLAVVPEPATRKNKADERPVPSRETIAAAASPAPVIPAALSKFEDHSFGYSFEYPKYWSGGSLTSDDLQTQRIDSGAIFRSQEDAAFTHAIWNSLKNANSTAYDNNLIVDLVIKSIGNSAGLQGLVETSRRMVQDGDQIKTYVDLKTNFRQPTSRAPLEFQGKAVIIRANAGILLVVAFYASESAPTMVGVSDKIIGSARVP